MKNFVIPILILLYFSANSQKIDGKIIDHATKKPVPLVTILNKADNKLTFTNDDGIFEIQASKIPVELKVSHVSYKTQQFAIEHFNNNLIEIEENIIELPEFSTGNKASILLDQAIQKAQKDSSVYHYCKMFFQKVAKEAKNTTNIHEIFFDAAWNSFGIKLWNPTNARYAERKSHHSFQNMTTYSFFLLGVISKNIALPNNIINNKGNYKYTISGILNENTENEIIIIKCTPLNRKIVHFEGDIYINPLNYNILRIEGNYYQYKKKNIDRISFKNNYTHISINFKEDSFNRSCFQSAELTYNITMNYAMIASRHFSERVKIISYEDVKSFDKLTSAFVRSDIDLIKKTKYEKSFWENNPIIKHTPILKKDIKGFEDDKAFGNYFDK